MTAEHCACLCTGHASCLNAHRLLDRSESSLCSRRLSERLAYLVSLLPRLCKQKAWCEMISEWEKLETLSKDYIIIELMHWKTLYSILRNDQDDSCSMPEIERADSGSEFEDFNPGEVTSDSWAEKIALYAIARSEGPEFWPCDLRGYGLTDQQSFDVCKRLLDDGRLNLPSGIILRGI